ncbi:MAG: putative two-component response regulator [Chloroflexi bacterium]|jgi:DNA-binding NarL/FixJ family response regulator|nr:putative two-component response regulator [Chloroflexota bacterium]
MRVVLADKQADVRSALRLLLAHDLGMQVVGEVADAPALRKQLQDTRPDLLLLDWGLLGNDASAAPARLHATYPNILVVVLSEQPEARRQALAAGADAFVSKAASPEQMIATLRLTVERAKSERPAGSVSELEHETNV